ncbi:MAG TPA: hypothetical protein VK464_09350 [Symbiobacteriaceae bacterium]|nr:hypothetical protein [Symbiobacteriaceae bacterium]
MPKETKPAETVSSTAIQTMDPLEALLSVDVVVPEDEVFIKRLNTYFKVKAPTAREYKALTDRSVRETGKGKNRTRNLELDKFQKLLVYTFTVNPDLSNPKLMERYGALAPEDVVEKALLPGEIDRLAERILELGGFGEEDDLVDDAKN